MENQSTSQVAERKPTVRSLLLQDSYKARFNEMLGKRAGPFCASLVTAANSYQLRSCEPQSVIAAAIVAASLDLPIDKNLGMAHIVPYKGVASFQMGYKGFIQLALRSGQFKSMRDAKINAEAFCGLDKITGDPIIDWGKIDESQEIIGYAFAWRLTNGFEKIVYWTRKQVEEHAKRFSQAYKAKKADSPWTTDFDSMALKTVIKSALAKWAPLSLDMQQAVIRDESSQKDIDAEIAYVDGTGVPVEDEPKKPIFTPPAGAEEGKNPDLEEQVQKAPEAEKGSPPEKTQPDATVLRTQLIDAMKSKMLDCMVTEEYLWKYAHSVRGLVPKGVTALWDLPTEVLAKLQFAIVKTGSA